MAKRPEPACARCGNEEDLERYTDGCVYCLRCLICPHNAAGNAAVCTTCFRQLHTVMTAEGPRIRDVEVYAICARDEYGLYLFDVRTWTFEEEELLHRLDMVIAASGPRPEVTAAPPHHRLER